MTDKAMQSCGAGKGKMTEMKVFLKMTQSQHKCSIIQYPSGRFWFVGSIPQELCFYDEKGMFPQWKSKVYSTRQEAEKELHSIN